jgi:hypothetical protein
MTAHGLCCPLCHTVILATQQTVASPGASQIHVACLIRRQPMIGPHSGA